MARRNDKPPREKTSREQVETGLKVDVSRYLTSHRADGIVESEGFFTINSKDAERKLGAFQLSSPESWVLVLVQAANRSQAKRVDVVQFPRQTTVTISAGRQWDWQALAGVLAGEKTKDDALLSIAVAVRALKGNTHLRAFRVRAPNGWWGTWKGEQMVLEAPPLGVIFREGDAIFEADHVGVFEETSWFIENRGTARATLLAINQALVKNCVASGVPVFCDSRPISGVELGSTPKSFQYRRLVALLPFHDPRIPAVDFSAAYLCQRDTLAGIQATVPGLAPPSERVPSSGLAAVSLNLSRSEKGKLLAATELGRGPSKLLWVLDGVVVHEQAFSLRGSLALTLVVSAAGLKTDLSGLKLVQNELFDQRLEWLAEAVVPALESLWEQSQGEGVQVTETTSKTGPALFLAACVAGALFYPPSLLLSAPAAVTAAVGAKAGASDISRWEPELDEELRTLAERAASELRHLRRVSDRGR